MRDTEPLLEFYAAYMTTVQADRLNALRGAILWLEEVIADDAQTLFTELEQNRFTQAAKARNLALADHTEANEAEAASLMTIRLYERLLQRFGFSGRPIDEVVSLLELNREAIAIQEEADRLAVGGLLNGIQEVFRSFRINFSMAHNTKKRRAIVPGKEIIFSVEYLKELQAIADDAGIFAVLLSEILPIVVKAMSFEQVGSSDSRPSSLRLQTNLETVALHLAKFAHANGLIVDVPLDSLTAKPDLIPDEWFRGRMSDMFAFLQNHAGKPIPYELVWRLGGERTDAMLEFIRTTGERCNKFKLTIVKKFYVKFAIL